MHASKTRQANILIHAPKWMSKDTGLNQTISLGLNLKFYING
jgi:hypothetical protein